MKITITNSEWATLSTPDILTKIEAQLDAMISQAVAEEREACARILDEQAAFELEEGSRLVGKTCELLAHDMRRRSVTPLSTVDSDNP